MFSSCGRRADRLSVELVGCGNHDAVDVLACSSISSKAAECVLDFKFSRDSLRSPGQRRCRPRQPDEHPGTRRRMFSAWRRPMSPTPSTPIPNLAMQILSENSSRFNKFAVL